MTEPRGKSKPVGSRLRAWAIFGAVVLAIPALIYGGRILNRWTVGWLATSSWGQFRELQVYGLERAPESKVTEAVNVEIGDNLMILSLDSVAARVESMSIVKHARAVRRIPGRLVIRIEERQPLAVIAGKTLQLVDAEGVVFKQQQIGEVIDLPVITGLALQPDAVDLPDVVKLIENMGRVFPSLYENLGEVHITGRGTVELTLRQGGAKIITRHKLDDRMLALIEEFLSKRDERLPPNLKYIDLRFEDRIVTG